MRRKLSIEILVRIFYFVVVVIGLIELDSVDAKRVPLLDTTEQSVLRWTTYSSSSEEGWMEESYTNSQEGINWRSYIVCEVRRENIDNWVRTPFIQRGDARRVSIEMTFTIRDCKMFPHTARTCKETFTLFAYESDFDFATKQLPEWSDRQLSTSKDGYRRIDRITADNGRFTSKENVVTNTVTRSVPVTKKGVYFAVRDEGACISLLSVKVYYEVCEEVVTNFAWFPETAVGANLTSIQETIGHCVDNASPPSPGAQPKYVCKADGTWDLLSGGCQCNPGYRTDGARCLACEAGFYKDAPGLAGCVACPTKSISKLAGASFCECEAGYYRAPSDSKSSPCTRPPSRPIELRVLKVEQTRAVLAWRQPEDLGGRSSVWYRAECPECPSDAQFMPAKKLFNTTTLTLTNLASGSLYTVFIYAENDITPQVDSLPMYAVVDVNTQSSTPSSGVYVADLRVDAVTASELNVSWTLPSSSMAYASDLVVKSHDNNNNDDHESSSSGDNQQQQRSVPRDFYYQYAVRLFLRDPTTNKRRLVPPSSYRGAANGNNETSTTHVPRYTFYNLQSNTDYGYQVQVIAPGVGQGAWSDVSWIRTAVGPGGGSSGELSKTADSSGGSIGSVIWPSIMSVVVLIFAFTALICFLKRRQRPLCPGEKQPSDLDVLEYKGDPLHSIRHQHTHSTTEYNSAATLARKLQSPLVQPQFTLSTTTTPFNSGYKSYVDPTTYEDPNQALEDNANEIPQPAVIIEEIIGTGEFGEVCRGKLKMPGGRDETVAIKTLKPNSAEKTKADFLTEASIMGQFDHPNVIKLKGVVTKTEPVMIITEYMENRSLDAFLKANDNRLDNLQLVSMLHGIANGMKYLSDKGYVHRDLAARNVLVDASFSCKIADFGLSRGLEGSIEQAYTTKGGKIPVRWTAPEAIQYRKFTSASDVWSYGVVMWEVMSYGERPYWEWTNQQVIEAIDKCDFRLPAPMDCPKVLHELMLQCWLKERHLRPNFAGILQQLQNFLQNPEKLYHSSTVSSISSPLGVSHSGDSLASLTSSTVLPSLCGGLFGAMNGNNSSNGNGSGGHPSTSSGFVSATASGAGMYQSTNPVQTTTTATSGSSTSSPTRNLISNMTLEKFLRDLGLAYFTADFQRHGFRHVNELTRLTVVDLASFGLQAHDQKRLMDALNRLQQRSASSSNTYYRSTQMPSQHHQQLVGQSNNTNEGFFV